MIWPRNEKPTFKNSYLSNRVLTNDSLLYFLQFSFYCLYFFIHDFLYSYTFRIGVTIATLVNSLKPYFWPPYLSCPACGTTSSSSTTLPPSNPKFKHLILRIMKSNFCPISISSPSTSNFCSYVQANRKY